MEYLSAQTFQISRMGNADKNAILHLPSICERKQSFLLEGSVHGGGWSGCTNGNAWCSDGGGGEGEALRETAAAAREVPAAMAVAVRERAVAERMAAARVRFVVGV